MSVAFQHRVPALRGWAVRQWCDRLRHPELDVDQAAHQLSALFGGTTSRLAVQLAADLLRRSVDLLQQLHKVLAAAPLHAVAQLALLHALLTGWPHHGDELTPSRVLLLEAIIRGSGENARDSERTPAMAAHETTVVQELRQAVCACTELPRMASESSSATSLLAALIGTEAIATVSLNLNAEEKGTRAGEKALLDSDREYTHFATPSYRLATSWEDCDKLMDEVQTEAHEAAVASIEFDSISAGCANAVYARAWHWPQNKARDDATTFTPGAAAASDVLTSGTPISERTLTQIFQQLLPFSAVVVPPCFLCTARALAAVLRYNGTAASTLIRVGMRHAASLQGTSAAGRSGALPSSCASNVSELVASLLVTTLTLYADAIYEPVDTRDSSPNTLPASGDSPCAEGSTKGERCNRVAHIRQLLHSAERLETSGLLIPIAPFRIPHCATARSKGAAHNHGDLKSRLLSRQWEGGTHAVLDTLLSAATRAMALTPLLEAMYAATNRMFHHRGSD
ncbi:hypothetical protein AB1Y20_009393 [Prymnesium parvum]|uniref:Uncharacterized protein n=1 Tax=Prymnesium parvum TaxID=97485 RepID=A0AB34K6D9_PRYPA